MPGSGIHYLIYPRQEKTIFWADVIQINVIDTDSPFSYIFWDYDHVY